jgi:transposase
MEGHLVMSRKERERAKLFERVKKGELKLVEVSEVSGLSYRQCKRIYKRYSKEGDEGLVHLSRGQASNRGYGAEIKKQVLDLYQKNYPDFGPTLAAEKLCEKGHEVDHETLRRWLIEAGIWQKRRKRARHRSWRERRAHFGELVQLDGSHHEWFEKRASKCCLMNMVDDATGTTLAHFSKEETIFSAMGLLWKWMELYGIPQALYTDKKNVYVADEKVRARAAEEGAEVLTQFGRACKTLGIRIITAHSPQAKGRVERSHGTYQDRVVKELRLEAIDTTEGANKFFEGGYLKKLNEKFAVAPRSEVDYHRPVKDYDLASILCLEEERSASSDWVVRFENGFYQLLPEDKLRSGKGKVTVQRYLNGELHFRYQGEEVSYRVLAERPEPKDKIQKRKKVQGGETIMEKYVPAVNHPWRGFSYGKGKPLDRR